VLSDPDSLISKDRRVTTILAVLARLTDLGKQASHTPTISLSARDTSMIRKDARWVPDPAAPDPPGPAL
jgi:hypothetical protein